MSEQDIISSQKPLFIAEFMQGHSLRGIVDYLKLTNVDGTFIFSKDSINYSQCDASQSILNDLSIRTVDLTHYEYNFDASEAIAYGVNMMTLKQTMAIIGKKDGVRFISYPTQPYLFIQHLGQGADEASRKNINIIKVQSADATHITVDGYTRLESDPNCTVQVQDFCKTCTNIVKVKCDNVTIKGNNHGIRFQAMLDGNIAGSYYEFGNFSQTNYSDNNKSTRLKKLAEYLTTLSFDSTRPESEDKVEEGDSIQVKTCHIKSLSKLASSFKEGTVKMYIETGMPLKLVFNNSYAKLTVFLRDSKK